MFKVLLKGENETLGNLVSKDLCKDPGVTFAFYKKEHPFDEDIWIFFETSDDPQRVWQTMIIRLTQKIKNLQKKLCNN